MPAIQKVKLFPSTTNYQHANEDVWTWPQLEAYFASIIDALPEADRASVRVHGMSGVSLHYVRTVSDDELNGLRVQRIREALMNASRDGLTGAQVADLLSELGRTEF